LPLNVSACRFAEKKAMLESLILGISTGTACVATCGMVMFPYLMSGSAGIRRITIDLSVFLASRFLAYFALATLSWYFGQTIFSYSFVRNIVPGVLYMVLSFLLVYYSIGKTRNPDCPGKFLASISGKKFIPIILGVVNSVGFCPALLIVLTKGSTQGSLMQSYMAFLAFYIGSSVWFIPIPFAGKIRRVEMLKTIGILATGLAGVIFMIKGITHLIGGIVNG
jgi:hypothetical protein